MQLLLQMFMLHLLLRQVLSKPLVVVEGFLVAELRVPVLFLHVQVVHTLKAVKLSQSSFPLQLCLMLLGRE